MNEMHSLELASEEGPSSWLYHFNLTKSEFRDGIALCYGWNPMKMPPLCACNENFAVAHVLHCPEGGYTHMTHNELHDSFVNLLVDVCHDVEIEPDLQPLQGETFAPNLTTDDDARLEIKVNGLWESRFNKTYYDVKIFNPRAKSCSESSIPTNTMNLLKRTNMNKE